VRNAKRIKDGLPARFLPHGKNPAKGRVLILRIFHSGFLMNLHRLIIAITLSCAAASFAVLGFFLCFATYSRPSVVTEK
jgi:hypothetical protein